MALFGPGQSSPAVLLSPNSFHSLEPFPEAKDLVVTLEKRTISYLSVSARIGVIDPFTQMKREYITIIPQARMGSESIANEAEARMGSESIAHEAEGRMGY